MPLLSSIGGGSVYAYRGNYDDWPDPFIFEDRLNLLPGTLAESTATITGINYKSVIQGSSNLLISVNNGPFISSPQFIRNGQTATVRYQTDVAGTDSDFNTTFSSTITIGKRTSVWTVTTKIKDNTPTAFTFNSVDNAEISTQFESNIVSIGELEPNYTTFAFITSGTASFSVNGGPYVTSASVSNGNTIRMRQTSSSAYDTTVSSTISVGDYSTSYTIRTRLVDNTVDGFSFTPVTNADINQEYISNTVTISGADSGIALLASVSSPGLLSVNSSPTFSSALTSVFNGNTVRLKIPSSVVTEYSKTYSSTLNISGTSATYTVSTRARPVNTIPNQFTFNNITGSPLFTVRESNTITLSGMTTGDFGTATITGTGGNGTPAQFRVIRSSAVIRDYSSSSFQVTNGDQIQLRMTSSGESSTVQSTFTVSGTNTTTNLSGSPGSRSANWSIQTGALVCIASDFSSSFTNVTTDTPGELKSESFTVSGLNEGCNNIVTTSDGNSYLRLNGSQGTSLSVKNGDLVEVYMTSPPAGTTRTTTVTVRRPSGTNAVSANWSITTSPPLSPPIVNISLSPSSIFTGNSSTLTWSTSSATTLVSSNFGASSLVGSISVNPTSSRSYSLTVSGPGGQVTGSATLTVSSPPPPPPNPPTITLTASPSSIQDNGSTTLTWSSTNATSVSSSNFGATTVSGSLTRYGLRSSTTFTITVSGPGGSASASASVNVAVCSPSTSSNTFQNLKQGTIVYGNGFTETITFFASSKSIAYSTTLSKKPSFTYGQVQDSISAFYRGTLGRPADPGAISPTSYSWISVFNDRPDLTTLSALNDQILATYNADPPSGSGERSIVASRGGRAAILDSCGNTWTP